MDVLLEFISLYRTALIAFAVIVTTGIFLIIKKDELGVYWLRFTYGMPIFGKSKKLAKDFQMKQMGSGCWFLSEEILCSEFQKAYDDKNEGTFKPGQDSQKVATGLYAERCGKSPQGATGVEQGAVA